MRRLGLGGDGGLPVRLIDEHRSEVTDDVDYAEDEPLPRKHGEVRPLLISVYWTARSQGELFRRSVAAVGNADDGLELLIHGTRAFVSRRARKGKGSMTMSPYGLGARGELKREEKQTMGRDGKAQSSCINVVK